MGPVITNLKAIQLRIDEACARVDRSPDEVTLIAVSKTFGIDLIREAYDAGHRHFGESRLQEAIQKIEALPDDIIWHFIGPMQSNKAKRIAKLFKVIHSVENEGQIREITKSGQHPDCLLEVNIGAEPQKQGLLPDLNILQEAKAKVEAAGLPLRGLMTIGPAIGPEAIRPYFKKMRELRATLNCDWLSMGMSQDFEVAIEEGATHIRVGSSIFGSR